MLKLILLGYIISLFLKKDAGDSNCECDHDWDHDRE